MTSSFAKGTSQNNLFDKEYGTFLTQELEMLLEEHGLPSKEEVVLVQQSFALIRPLGIEFTSTVFADLFELDPKMKPMFASHRMRGVERMLMQALILIVDNLENPAKLEVILVELGRRHLTYGVLPEYYPKLQKVLFTNMKTRNPENWTPEVERAWTKAFRLIIDLMTAGAVRTTMEKTSNIQKQYENSSSLHSIKKESIPDKIKKNCYSFLHFFWELPDWSVFFLAIVIFFLIDFNVDKESVIKGMIEEFQNLGLFIGLMLYLKEAPARRRNFHYQAFGAIDNAGSNEISAARIMALEDLNQDKVSLKGFAGSGKNFNGINMTFADLSHSIFEKSSFNNAKFDHANFNYANLSQASAVETSFEKAQFNFAKLIGGKYNASNFEHCTMICANLSNADFTGSNLRYAKMKGCDFNGTFFAGADLTGAEINEEDLKKAILYETILPSGNKS